MKHMKYPTTFNLKKHMLTDGCEGSDEIYDLYGVTVHSGWSTSSGHYYSYCKTHDNRWFECNDSFVSQTNEATALNQEAYLLFY